MPAPIEHYTVQAHILKCARDVGWTFLSREKAEERRAGFPTRQSRQDASRNARTPFMKDMADWKVRPPLKKKMAGWKTRPPLLFPAATGRIVATLWQQTKDLSIQRNICENPCHLWLNLTLQ